MKYIMQNINAYSGQVLRETEFKDQMKIDTFIRHYERLDSKLNQEMMIVLIDKDKEAWNAGYLGYVVDNTKEDAGIISYKFVFKVKKSNYRVRIK
ncbi:hypothetical protein [Peribacillus asahii]|uniref:hypothetical protein n=1 Tax=Peribacillus asahii TaxID=228899 RepID=UPI00382C0EEE